MTYDYDNQGNKVSVIYIGGEALPMPAFGGYTTTVEELVAAERNVSTGALSTIVNGGQPGGDVVWTSLGYKPGELIKKRIALKHTVNVQWAGLTPYEKDRVMLLTSPNDFIARFLDLDTNEYLDNVKMYRASGQQVRGVGRFDMSTRTFQYYDVTMSLIEL